MNVTYKLIKNKETILNLKKTACFSHLTSDFQDYDSLEILVYECESNKGNLDFWTKLIMKIEPKAKLIDKNWMIFPYMPYGKMLLILTLLRYLWEHSNHYDDIIPMTKKILEITEDIDEMQAITLAASCTEESSGWGHSHVLAVASTLPRIWHYRRYTGNSCQGLCGKSGNYVTNEKVLNEIRNEKKDKFDVIPILKHFKIKYNE
jgi:hypothetical protein